MKAYMYILNCADGSYYTGSTTELDAPVVQHQNGEGSIYTRERLPVKLVHFEEYPRIDRAFWREQQVKKWSRKKKQAVINRQFHKLRELSSNSAAKAPSTHASTSVD